MARDKPDELALIGQEIGAEVIRGTVRYPGSEGGFDIGETDLEELLWKLKDQEVVVVIAPLGPTEELPVICGLCGTPYDGDECPTCSGDREQANRMIEERLRQDREEKDSLSMFSDWLCDSMPICLLSVAEEILRPKDIFAVYTQRVAK